MNRIVDLIPVADSGPLQSYDEGVTAIRDIQHCHTEAHVRNVADDFIHARPCRKMCTKSTLRFNER